MLYDVDEWLVKIAESVYRNDQICVIVSGVFSDNFQCPGRIMPKLSAMFFVIYDSAGGTI